MEAIPFARPLLRNRAPPNNKIRSPFGGRIFFTQKFLFLQSVYFQSNNFLNLPSDRYFEYL